MPKHPYKYGFGSRQSSLYTMGRDGKPLPAYAGAKNSAMVKAWRIGHAEYLKAKRKLVGA